MAETQNKALVQLDSVIDYMLVVDGSFKIKILRYNHEALLLMMTFV